jgi:molybdopterin biosynthesis enzyme MoaB
VAKVRRDNRILTVSETEVNKYLQQGYDQIDDKGKVIKRATGGRTVPIAEYNRVLEENEKLKAEIEELKMKEKKGAK